MYVMLYVVVFRCRSTLIVLREDVLGIKYRTSSTSPLLFASAYNPSVLFSRQSFKFQVPCLIPLIMPRPPLSHLLRRMSTSATSTTKPLRIGYVPEHYLLPFHLARRHIPFQIEPIPFPSGTGHMITSLRSNDLDIAIGLTEGWVAGLLGPAGRGKGGYHIVGSWVRNPLRWSIVTGRRREFTDVESLGKGRRVKLGVSRLGSGSHVMGFVLGRKMGWLESDGGKGMDVVPLGPFKELRDGVGDEAKADFFMWEHFTTKPYFHGEGDQVSLKRLGEILTPWPSWHIAASDKTFSDPEKDAKLAQVFEALDKGVQAFKAGPEEGLKMLSTGELGCLYSEEDAREWLKAVDFFEGSRGVDTGTMESVVDVLKDAGVIEREVEIEEDARVVGIER